MERESLLITSLKTLLAPIILLCVGGVLSAIVIPGIVSDSSEIESLHEARLKTALEFGARNEDFVGKLNVLRTLMQMFHEQNVRMNISPQTLSEAQTQFRKEYTDKYLALDSTAWWWYWDVEREAQIFNLLSPAELKLLHEEIGQYGNSVLACKNATDALWNYLSSEKYSLSPMSRQRFTELAKVMNADLDKASRDRDNHVYNVSQLFARSVHKRPRKGVFKRIFAP